MKTGHDRNQESLNQIFNTRQSIKSNNERYYWSRDVDGKPLTREEYIDLYGEEPSNTELVTEVNMDIWQSKKYTSRRPIKSGYKLPHGETKSEYQLRENFQHIIERAYLDSNGKLNKVSIENAFTEAMEDILEKDPDFFNFYNDEE